jgi:hypothetical protein
MRHTITNVWWRRGLLYTAHCDLDMACIEESCIEDSVYGRFMSIAVVEAIEISTWVKSRRSLVYIPSLLFADQQERSFRACQDFLCPHGFVHVRHGSIVEHLWPWFLVVVVAT